MRKLATFLAAKGGASKGIRKLGNAILGGGWVWIRPITLTTASALIAAAAAPAMAGEMPHLVNCALPEPQSIQDVLAGVDPDPGETLTITVRGLCTEDVVIVSDDITLQGEMLSDGRAARHDPESAG